MKTILATLVLLTATTGFCADAKPAAGAPDAKKMKEMMKAFEKASTPGKQHKMLADMAGEWSYVSKSWMSPDAQPEESSGTSSMKMILGGRWLQHNITGTAMGKPFEGMGLIGYNNTKAEYETIWLDSFSTAAMMGEGHYESKTKTLTDKGEYTCPMTPEKERDYRGEWKIVSKNKMIYSLHGTTPGIDKEFKMMEITYSRK